MQDTADSCDANRHIENCNEAPTAGGCWRHFFLGRSVVTRGIGNGSRFDLPCNRTSAHHMEVCQGLERRLVSCDAAASAAAAGTIQLYQQLCSTRMVTHQHARIARQSIIHPMHAQDAGAATGGCSCGCSGGWRLHTLILLARAALQLQSGCMHTHGVNTNPPQETFDLQMYTVRRRVEAR